MRNRSPLSRGVTVNDTDMSRGRPERLRGYGLPCWVAGGVGTGSSWTDLSGNAHHLLQATGAKQPTITASAIKGKAAYLFDGSDDFMQGAFTLIEPETIFLVFNMKAVGAATVNDAVLDGVTVASMFVISDNAPRLGIYNGATLFYNAAVAAGTYAQATFQFNGASSVVRTAGVARSAGDAGNASSASGLTVAALGGGTRPTNVEVAEIVIVAGATNASATQRCERYLRGKYF